MAHSVVAGGAFLALKQKPRRGAGVLESGSGGRICDLFAVHSATTKAGIGPAKTGNTPSHTSTYVVTR